MKQLNDKVGIGSKKKPKTKSFYKAKAWKAFSEWVRRSSIVYSELVRCYTCNNLMHWKESQAGHGIGGRGNAVLFMTELVRVQCKSCNIFKGGNYPIFTRSLIKEYGLDKYDELVTESQKVVQYKSSDYIEIEKKYKVLLESL